MIVKQNLHFLSSGKDRHNCQKGIYTLISRVQSKIVLNLYNIK